MTTAERGTNSAQPVALPLEDQPPSDQFGIQGVAVLELRRPRPERQRPLAARSDGIRVSARRCHRVGANPTVDPQDFGPLRQAQLRWYNAVVSDANFHILRGSYPSTDIRQRTRGSIEATDRVFEAATVDADSARTRDARRGYTAPASLAGELSLLVTRQAPQSSYRACRQ